MAEAWVTRLVDRCRDWRHDARFGVVLLVGVALVAGVIWYRIGIGGASAGESGAAAPAAVSTTAPSTTLVDPTPTGRAGNGGHQRERANRRRSAGVRGRRGGTTPASSN